MAIKKPAKKRTAKKKGATKKSAANRKGAKSKAAVPTFLDQRLDCLPSPNPEEDWRFGHLEDAGVSFPEAGELPQKVDLRESWWEIADQKNSGSCVGWALADSVLRWHFVKDSRLDKSELLSPRFLWMAAKETDDYVDHPQSFIESAGTCLKAAIKITDKYGCVPDDMLPFNSNSLYPGSTISFYRRARDFRIRGYTRLITLREWKRWLAKGNGPILIRVEVDKTWHDIHEDGLLDEYDPYSQASGLGGGHAAAIVGYTEAGNFIIRNSWGTAWGKGGFAFGSPLYMDKAVTEAFGIDI